MPNNNIFFLSEIFSSMLLCFINIAILILLGGCLGTSEHSPEMLVMSDSDTIKNYIFAHKIKYGDYPEVVMHNEKPDISILQRELKIESNEINHKLFLDPWGNQYHIVLDIDNNQLITIGDKVISSDIVIWSDGPDKINEQGFGDDIMMIWRRGDNGVKKYSEKN